MRSFRLPPALLSLLLAGGLTVGVFAAPGQAAPTAAALTAPARGGSSAAAHPDRPAPQATAARSPELAHSTGTSDLADRAPRDPATARADQARPHAAPTATAQALAAAAASCTPGDFSGRTGSALVQQIKSSTVDCINSLFPLTGTDAHGAFREAQMVTVANALRDVSANYPGDDSTSATQLVLYLRAGYFVQWYHPADVGTYGTALQSAIRGALDAFWAAPHSGDVTEANGQTLDEAVTLIDSAGENARYLYVVKRLLTGYTTAWNSTWSMPVAVNNTYTVLWRGHQSPDFVTAVQNDPSVLNTLDTFATANSALLGGDHGYLVSNAGRELGRFLQHAPLQPTVRPLVKHLLGLGTMTGPTAPLWVGLAEMTDTYDQSNCASYGTCDLANRLKSAVLATSYTCSTSIRILAQQMSAAELAATCTSLRNQDAYVHGVVRDNGPVAGDNNTTIEVDVFDSSTDYQTYAGAVFGIDTNNGGMYLEGDPAAAGNQPRFVAYEAEWQRPDFQIWNLNHEYTHYLDGRFDMYGDFNAAQGLPAVWWIEGFAEYVSYSYRGVTYTDALTEAGKHTYALSTLFDTTYDNADQTRIYNWGYLAVRYMLQSHRADVDAILAKYRTGDWTGARTYLKTTIGTRYDADFNTWLTACNAGHCDTTPPAPECTGADSRQLDKNCRRSNLAATTGNYAYLYLYVPAGTAKLTITSAGGTGNADLYYNGAGWATTGSYQAKSTASGNNETLTVTNPPAGYSYISLYAQQGFSGASVTTSY
ncbi:M9 family metallopeptidase [Kitasatospora cinereorecta]|uniref:microbial collagenase n=1 Tax=Kitasatospora cinereorecta TaxID=285560 RepID=A0ABW0V7W0_9ACTN